MYLTVIFFFMFYFCTRFHVFKTWQVTVPHVDAEFFCLLEESNIGPETERSTSLAYVLIIFLELFKEPIKIKAILIRLVNIEESLRVRYSFKQQALDVRELFNDLFPIMIQSKRYAVYPHLCLLQRSSYTANFCIWYHPKKKEKNIG